MEMGDSKRMKMTDLNDFQLEQPENQRDTSNMPSRLKVATEEPKTITNIYYDCLERIFDFLDLGSLLNVAHTCKRLQIAAAAKFGDDYGKKCCWLYLLGYGIFTKTEHIDFEVCGLELALPFLRCFGAKISQLCVDSYRYGGYTLLDDTNEIRLYRYINQYCANTLSHISIICGNWKFLNRHFQMPFVNVVAVEMQEFRLNDRVHDLPNISKCFPNTRHLTIDDKIVSIFVRENDHFSHLPHLEHLVLKDATAEYAARILRKNPQLQSFKFTPRIYEMINFNHVVNMLAGNSSVSNLQIDEARFDMINVNLSRLTKQCPRIEKLLICCNFTSDQAFELVSRLTLLKRFEFGMIDRSEFDHLVARLDDTWKHSFHVENPARAYLLEREQ